MMKDIQLFVLLKTYFDDAQNIIDVGMPINKTFSFEDIYEKWRLIICPGDIVMIGLPNSSHLLKHYFSILMCGGVPILIPPHLPKLRRLELIKNFNTAILLTMRTVETFSSEIIFILDNMVAWRLNSSVEKIVKSGEAVLLTSGTSGIGTGCIFDFYALAKNAMKHFVSINMKITDSVLINLPLYFSYAFVAQALSAILNGCRLIIMGPPFNKNCYLSVVEKFQITISSLTPVLVRDMLREDSVRFPNCLRVLTIGGDRIEPVFIEKLLNSRKNKELYITYGLTEAGPRVATLCAHAEPSDRFSSVGLPLPGVTAKIQCDNNNLGIGVLHIFSDTLMKRRITAKDNQVKSFHSEVLDTGDIFRQDANGYLYFQGRVSDFLIIQGEKVSLHTIRQLIKSISGIVAVKTIPDKINESYSLILSVKNLEMSHYMLKEKINNLLRPYERPKDIKIIKLKNEVYENHK